MNKINRRDFITTCGAVCAVAPATIAAKSRFTLGIGTYTYHSLSDDAMIERLVALKIREIELSSPNYFLPSLKMETLPILKTKLDRAGIAAVSYFCGAIKDESDLKRTIQAAKALGARHVTGDGPGSSLKMIEERFTRENLRYGIHNHFFKGRKFEFESADDMLRALNGLSETIGITLDTGHLAVFGYDPLEALKKVKSRLQMVHIKDIASTGDDKNVLFGTGIGKVAEVIEALKQMDFAGPVEIEYEVEGAADPQANVARCVEFVRQRM